MTTMDKRHYELAATIEAAAREFGTIRINPGYIAATKLEHVGACTVTSLREWDLHGLDAHAIYEAVFTFFARSTTWKRRQDGQFEWREMAASAARPCVGSGEGLPLVTDQPGVPTAASMQFSSQAELIRVGELILRDFLTSWPRPAQGPDQTPA